MTACLARAGGDWSDECRAEAAQTALQLMAAKLRSEHIERDEIGDLGLTRAFTVDKVAQLDRVLHVADDLARRPTNGVVAGNGVAENGKVPDDAVVG